MNTEDVRRRTPSSYAKGIHCLAAFSLIRFCEQAVKTMVAQGDQAEEGDQGVLGGWPAKQVEQGQEA